MKKLLSLVASLALAFTLIVTPAYAETSEAAKVSNADELIAALEKNEDVVFTTDIKIDPANMSSGYGTTGINVKNGQTIDGAGFTLDIEGAGGTWDSGINTTGGSIKNITIGGSFRGIFTGGLSQDLIIDNVVIDNVCYTIHRDSSVTDEHSLIVTNSVLNGWTSYNAFKTATFTNCTFGKGTGGYQYAYMRPYGPTTYVDCTFEEGYEFDASKTEGIVFENCYVGDTLITNDNITDQLGESAKNGNVINMAAQIGDTKYPTLDAAINAAKDGDTVILLHDVEYTSQLQVHKEITLDLNGNTITTSFGWGGISLKNNCSLINGNIIHNGKVAAIKVWNAKKLEDLNIQVTPVEGKEIGGISVQANPDNYVESIKNVTITGASYGIETQYVGESTNPVIGTMDNLNISAINNGLKLLAPSGTIKNSTITSKEYGINMFRKGLASVTLTVENCDVNGDTAVYLHDENFSRPDLINNGEISINIDSDTMLTSANGKTLAYSEVGTTGKAEVSIETDNGICPITGDDGEITYVASHSFHIINDKDATCDTKGYTGDEVCKECGYIKTPGKDIEALGHTYEDGVCKVCGDKEPVVTPDPEVTPKPEKDPTKTGDEANIALFAGLALLAAGSMYVLRRKEEL